jgi:alpha-ketoglutarate-dependent taurine dioxygenase
MKSKFGSVKPQATPISEEQSIEIGRFESDDPLPLVVRAKHQTTALTAWVRANQAVVEEALKLNGGILFRDFSLDGIDDFGGFVRSFHLELLEYKERSTPRTKVGDRLYTSTEYPAHQHIALHNEFSYSFTWPMRIFFFASQAPESGGQTPIADSRRVYQGIAPDVRRRFIEKKVMYVRNYGTGIDLSWQEAFQTNDKAEVEEHCRRAPLDWEWLDGDRLRTCQVRPSVAQHPITGEMVWFNQAHLFHVSNLGSETQESIYKVFDEQDLPRNAYYGDGSPFSSEDLDEVRRAYKEATVVFSWQPGDILMLDNMLVAHGRRPYSGQRRILVALAQPYSLSADMQTV